MAEGPNLKEIWDKACDVAERPELKQEREERCNGIKASDLQIGGDHYQSMTIQASEFIEKNGLGWCEGNAIKYICRHNRKGEREDIEKAIHYLQLILEWEYKND